MKKEEGRRKRAVVHRLPMDAEIDLHTFQAREMRSVVDEYIVAASEAGLSEVRLVHGRGKGIQRGIVQAALEAHELVLEFWDDPRSSLGATIAMIRRR